MADAGGARRRGRGLAELRAAAGGRRASSRAEARGFLLGPALARELGAGFVLARKPGKLPYETVQRRVPARVRHRRARGAHRRGRARARACSSTTTCWPPAARRSALCELVEQLGGEVVGCAFLIELAFLGGPRAARAATTCTRCCATRPSRPTCRRRARSRTVAAPPEARLGDGRPTRTTCRAGGRASSASRTSSARRLHARCCAPSAGARGARRLPRRAGAPGAAAACAGSQEVEGTPFERVLSRRRDRGAPRSRPAAGDAT